MVPDIGQRLQAVIRALEETILPAIDPAQSTAVDQARLAILTLQLAARQHASTLHLALVELRQYAALLGELRATAGAALEPALRDALAQAAADPLATLRVPALDDIEQRTRAYRELADAVLESPALAVDDALWHRVAGCITEHAARETLQRRAWIAAPGTEMHPESLPSIADIVAPAILPPDRRV